MSGIAFWKTIICNAELTIKVPGLIRNQKALSNWETEQNVSIGVNDVFLRLEYFT